MEHIDEVYALFNLQNAEKIYQKSNWAEDVVRFLNNPIVSYILIMIGILGLIAEVKSPGAPEGYLCITNETYRGIRA